MKKTERLNLRLEKKEMEKLKSLARRLGFSLSQAVRYLIRKGGAGE